MTEYDGWEDYGHKSTTSADIRKQTRTTQELIIEISEILQKYPKEIREKYISIMRNQYPEYFV